MQQTLKNHLKSFDAILLLAKGTETRLDYKKRLVNKHQHWLWNLFESGIVRLPSPLIHINFLKNLSLGVFNQNFESHPGDYKEIM